MPVIEFFQAGIRRENAMRTVSSCKFRYAPLTRPVIKEIQEEEKRLGADKNAREKLREVEKMPGARALGKRQAPVKS